MAIFERIKIIRTEAGLSQEAFANSIGLKRANYAQIEAGNQNPTIPVIIEIVKNYNRSYEWLLEGVEIAPNAAPNAASNEGKVNLVNIIQLKPGVVNADTNKKRVIVLIAAKAAKEYLNGYADADFIKSLPVLIVPGYTGISHRAFEIQEQSMLPTHHSGSIAIGSFVSDFNELIDRHVYIVVTKTHGIVLRRVLNRFKEDGKLILISDNENKQGFPNCTVDIKDILELWYWQGSIISESPEPGGVYERLNELEAKLTLLQDQVLKLNP